MNAPQIIKTPGGEEMVVLPKAEYEALLQAAEDVAGVTIYDARKSGLGEAAIFPAELSMAVLRGESRLKAIRKWRGLTQEELAQRAGLTQGFLSDLESRKRNTSVETALKLAQVLDVEPDWISG